MQTKQKYILWIVVIGLVLTSLYALMNRSEKIENSTSSSSTQTSNTGDTLERIKIYSGSETSWGPSPFASGAPLSESGDTSLSSSSSGTGQKWVFHQPNTEWKTRTISGVTYVFGEGNPREVMPKLSDYSIPSQDYMLETIVRPKSEQLLKNFLSNPLLAMVINKCGNLVVPDLGMASNLKKGLPETLFTTDFSMESMLTIDPTNGRKWVDWDRTDVLGFMFGQIKYGTLTSSPLISKCLTGSEIVEFDTLYEQFLAIGNSSANDSGENSKEVQDFLNGK